MKKEDLDALASLYEGVYSPAENGEYLVEGPYDAANVRAAQNAQQGRDTFRKIGGYAGLAQAARKGGASPEKALQAAQRTNLPTQGPTPAIPSASSVAADVAKANSPAVINRPAPIGSALAAQQSQQKKNLVAKAMTQSQSYEWPTAKTIKDIADAYASIYEAKKKDQDQDGDTDFADVQIARMMASGMSRAEAIAAVRNKEYNEEYELDEATRMRKEFGKEGETRVRGELAARSRAHKRSDSVDRTIAAAERGADRPYIKFKRDESDADRKKREEKQSRTLRSLASSRRGSVRDRPRVQMRGYAANVEGSDRDLQRARSSAMSAGTLTPKEKKQLGEEYQIYEIVASYLLENNFAEDIDDANAMIESMSSVWVGTIIEEYNEYVEDYNEFVEDLEIAGYDLSEATEEDIEEAYKDVDTKERVKRAANKEKAEKNIKKFSKYRAKGIEQSNRMRGALTGGRKADRPAVKGDKSKDEPGGYNPEKLNKDWQSRSTPDSKLKRRTAKGMESETVSQRMDREHPYKNRMTGKMGREYGSRAAANVTDVLRALEGNRNKRS